jgi:diacylglycerol kinase (ATP)
VAPNAGRRVAVVVNPRAQSLARVRERALARLRASAEVVAELATRGDADDARRLADVLAAGAPDVLVSAGGDGTANLALAALLATKSAERTALAFFPLGTGNNAARSFGLRDLAAGEAALGLALGAIEGGGERAIDVGLAGSRPFLGSLALGMDADVLALRNRVHRRLGPRGIEGGWSLYLASFAGSLVAGGHGGSAELELDGVRESCRLYNLAVVNAPIYAGPFRFDGANDCADGLLDVHAVSTAREYLTEYPSAWVRFLRGDRAKPSARLRRAREIRVELERPVPAQMDGEELAPAAAWEIRVLPRALRVCLPAASGGGAADRSR